MIVEQKPKDCKQVLQEMLRREDKQRKTVATEPTIQTTDDEKPEEECIDGISKKKSQNISFNESGQRESLAYTLASVLDSSP